MAYDIIAIKETLDLVAVFERDGMVARRVGGNLFVCCPFHNEDSPSCKVTAKRFKCFGCSEGGDIIDYWMRSRGLQQRDAISELGELAGFAPLPKGVSAPKPPERRKEDETIAPPLSAEQLTAWAKACEKLAKDEGQLARIAQWRGYSAELVRWAAQRGTLGLYPWSGKLREAFLVERPAGDDGLEPVSAHIRLAPGSRGNPTSKNSWRYDPNGAGSWPLILGDHRKADYLFMMEGEWDALALVEVMGWHPEVPPNIAIFGVRGAGTFLRLLSHYRFKSGVPVIAFCDADNAGSKWREPGGLLDTLKRAGHPVTAFEPSTPGADFNDALRNGLKRADLLRVLHPCLPSRLRTANGGPTFYQWLRRNVTRDPSIARTADIALRCKDRPNSRASRRRNVWVRHWEFIGAPPTAINDLIVAWAAYEKEAL